MKLLYVAKDGGPESNVTGYWLIEWKKYFSIVLLRFSEGTREAFHSHAFNAVSWVLYGKLAEIDRFTNEVVFMEGPSIEPIYTPREKFHRVYGMAKSTWVLSFRGPWVDRWQEYFAKNGTTVNLTHGRKHIS